MFKMEQPVDNRVEYCACRVCKSLFPIRRGRHSTQALNHGIGSIRAYSRNGQHGKGWKYGEGQIARLGATVRFEGAQFRRAGQGRGCLRDRIRIRYASRISSILPHSPQTRRNGPRLENKRSERRLCGKGRRPVLHGVIAARYALRRDLFYCHFV